MNPTIEPPSRRSTNCRTIIPKKFSHCSEISRTHRRFPNLGDLAKRMKIPREFDFGGQWDLITELSEDWGNRLLEGTNKPCAHQDPGERSSDSTRD